MSLRTVFLLHGDPCALDDYSVLWFQPASLPNTSIHRAKHIRQAHELEWWVDWAENRGRIHPRQQRDNVSNRCSANVEAQRSVSKRKRRHFRQELAVLSKP